MKVLWFSATPSLFDEQKFGGWIASLERIVLKHRTDIELAIAFEYNDNRFCIKKNETTYYPINISNTIKDRLIEKVDGNYKWNRLKPMMIKIIEDFKPDIIQCFGSEWPYGLIAEYVDTPVVVHMQGFNNIYNESSKMVYSTFDYIKCNRFNPKATFTFITNKKKNEFLDQRERHLMSVNKYFMGRTIWDKEIVEHYSPNATYFYCPEALRPEIYNSETKWEDNNYGKNRLATISQAGVLKGNEIILKTAKLLKDEFSFDFEWIVAGNPAGIQMAERKTGIDHKKYNVKLLGMIPADRVSEELANSTIYVHPAIIDNSPNSLCEAQIIGCPVIAANVGGISSLVDDGKTGILYPYNEPHMLAFRIMELCKDKEMLKALSENEKKLSLERHNPDKVYECLNNVYTELYANANRRSNRDAD